MYKRLTLEFILSPQLFRNLLIFAMINPKVLHTTKKHPSITEARQEKGIVKIFIFNDIKFFKLYITMVND